MVTYSCETCGQEFPKKAHYNSHKKITHSCENNTDIIEQMVYDGFEEILSTEKIKKMIEILEDLNSETVKKLIEILKDLINKEPMVENDNKVAKIKLQKPFLKWVGGKTQIINNVIEKFPEEINNYHELFLGGGSVLFAVLSLQKENKIIIKNKIYAYDINDNLINVYKHIQKEKDVLYKYFEEYIKEYDSIINNIINCDNITDDEKKIKIKKYRNPLTIEDAKTSKESYYYWIRDKYNKIDKPSIECSALFMFINKTCFRGMYREGPKGYNIPYGHYKTTPTIISKKDLDNISDLIKDVIFIHSDFNNSIKEIKAGDFVYLDPPYAPETENSFVGYVADGFSLKTHKKLFSEIKELNKQKIKFIMSNAKVELVLDNFKDYNCEDVIARRAINSKKPGSKTTEVIIYN